MFYSLSLLRRLRKIVPKELLIRIYNTYIQTKLDYGLTIWGCTTETNMNKVQRVQNMVARIISGNFDYVHFRGLDLVRELGFYDLRSRRDYFLRTFMFKAIHGETPSYISDRIVMNFDVNGYDTRQNNTMNVYLPQIHKELFRNSFQYSGGVLWNTLPENIKQAPDLNCFKALLKNMV